MAINNKDSGRQSVTSWPHKISWADVELKENKFINDEFEYYKAAKAKPKKHARVPGFFGWPVDNQPFRWRLLVCRRLMVAVESLRLNKRMVTCH